MIKKINKKKKILPKLWWRQEVKFVRIRPITQTRRLCEFESISQWRE